MWTFLGPSDVFEMLGVVWVQEKQELEEQRMVLMEEVQSYRNRIKQLEDDLLFRLSNSQARLTTSQLSSSALTLTAKELTAC